MKNISNILIAILSFFFFTTLAKVDNDTSKSVVVDTNIVIVDDEIATLEGKPVEIQEIEVIPELDKQLIQQRLNKIESNIPLAFNKSIYSFIHYFTIRNREYSKLMLARKDMYFPLFEKYLRENNMPDELKYLAIVESGLNPRARSRAGAVGLWQFMPPTGRQFKLNIDFFIDERSDPSKGTIAACKYLKSLYNMFDDWELALAAYNCGPGNIRKAIRKSGRKDFWELYNFLPKETRSYVPQFVALMYTMNYSKEHFLNAPYIDQHLKFDTLYVNQYMNLEKLEEFAGVCLDDIQKLNPTLSRNMLPSSVKNFPLLIPKDRSSFVKNNWCELSEVCSATSKFDLIYQKNPYSEHSDVNPNKANVIAQKIYIVKKGDLLNRIAVKYHVSMHDIKKWNNMHTMHVKVGQRLMIYNQKGVIEKKSSEEETFVSKREKSTQNTKNPKTYTVQPGDTLWSIAQKHYKGSLEQMKKLNNLKGNEIKVGQSLVLS